jgi:selenocysteine-specific elongation factor
MSKIDLVDEELLEVATAEVEDLVQSTFLAGKPIVPVSAVSGAGIDELRAALTAEAAAIPERSETGYFRLPVDRVFTMPGAGAVVTGTCWNGSVRPGDQLLVEPGARKVRVREVQVHGRKTAAARSGQRVALALHGVKKEELDRGHQVVSPQGARETRRLDLRIEIFSHYAGVVKNRQRLHVHHAGREVLGRVVLLDAEELKREGGVPTGLCQLHLEDPLIARAGDRLVLRFYSPVVSVAGGVIIDADPQRHRRFDEKVLQALAVREQGDPAALLCQELMSAGLRGVELGKGGAPVEIAEAVVVGGRIYHRDILGEEASAIGRLVTEYAERYPLRLGISKEEVRRRRRFPGGSAEWNALCQILTSRGGWVVVGDRIALGPQGPPLAPALADAVEEREQALRQGGLAWPGLAAFVEGRRPLPARKGQEVREEDVLRHLVDSGRAVQVASDYFVHAGSVAELVGQLRSFFAEHAEIDFAGFRDLSGLTRKLGIPLLEWLDAAGLTQRAGDVRRAGPALAASAEEPPDKAAAEDSG